MTQVDCTTNGAALTAEQLAGFFTEFLLSITRGELNSVDGFQLAMIELCVVNLHIMLGEPGHMHALDDARELWALLATGNYGAAFLAALDVELEVRG